MGCNAWVQLTAFAVCLIAWLIAGRDNPMVLMKVEPRYLLLGGVIGAGITLTVIRAMNQLGPAKAALLIVIAQLIVAYGIELLGLFGVDKEPLEWRKVIGMGIALIGIAIFSVEIIEVILRLFGGSQLQFWNGDSKIKLSYILRVQATFV